MDFPQPQGSRVEKCRFNGGSSEGWCVVMEVDETLQIFGVNRLSWDILSTQGDRVARLFWVAVKELKFSYHIGETLLFTIYTHYGNLI